MGWFSNQIKDRKINDKKLVSNAYSEAINAITGQGYSFLEDLDECEKILKFYGLNNVKIPGSCITDLEKLKAACSITGMMQRKITLNRGWYKDAFGAMLVKFKNNDQYVAILPDKIGRYAYFSKEEHKLIHLNRKTEALFDNENAYTFYKPLPNRKIGAFDLIKFGISAWSITDVLLVAFAILIVTLLGLLSTQISYFIMSKVIEQNSISLWISSLIFIITVTLANNVISVLKNIFTERLTAKSEALIKNATMMRVLSLSPRFFHDHSSGEILKRMTCMESIGTDSISSIFSIALTNLFSIVYVGQIFAYTPSLVIPAVIIVLLNLIFTIIYVILDTRVSKKEMELSADNTSLSLAMISGVQKIKVAGAEKRFFSKWLNDYSKEIHLEYNPPFLLKLSKVSIYAITLIGQFVMYFVALKSDIDVASYYAFTVIYAMFSAASTEFTSMVSNISNIKPQLDLAKPILEELPETNESLTEIKNLQGIIEVNNISFQYDKSMPNVINNLSFKIKKGEYVAIVGKTGCGKSTLIRLLLGFETPQKGAIYYDGHDLASIEKKSLRKAIGTVMQDDKLFIGDIYSNITVCAPHLPIEKVWEAVEIAGIKEDIEAMPMGMHTIISETGGISGGQRQRLMIARAIAPSPKVLIFDEATSALDNITQSKVSEALDKLNCTRIVIAHRLSTIKHCNRILVLDNGGIAEEGTYDELIAKNGLFKQLVDRQRIDN